MKVFDSRLFAGGQADWSELEAEEAYREKHRQQDLAREGDSVEWHDVKEREFRQKYIDLRYASGTMYTLLGAVVNFLTIWL